MNLCGDRVLKPYMAHEMGAGSLLILEVAMDLVFGSPLQKRLNNLIKIVFKLGDGRKIRFWEDTWCGRQPLCDAFLRLYSIADSKGLRLLRFG